MVFFASLSWCHGLSVVMWFCSHLAEEGRLSLPWRGDYKTSLSRRGDCKACSTLNVFLSCQYLFLFFDSSSWCNGLSVVCGFVVSLSLRRVRESLPSLARSLQNLLYFKCVLAVMPVSVGVLCLFLLVPCANCGLWLCDFAVISPRKGEWGREGDSPFLGEVTVKLALL